MNEPVESELGRLRERVASLEAELDAGKQRESALQAQIERWEEFARINPVWFWETDAQLRYTFFGQLSGSGGRAAGVALREDTRRYRGAQKQEL